MKGLIVLGNGFEDVEAISVIDLLRRSKLEIDAVTNNQTLEVETAFGITLKAQKFLKDVSAKDYDFLVIPGGRAVRTVWVNDRTLADLIIQFASSKKLVAAICAGPLLVGKLGLYKDLPYTCFPGSETFITAGKYSPKEGVITAGNFITAKAMGYGIDFGLAIIEYLQGKKQREQIYQSIRGEL